MRIWIAKLLIDRAIDDSRDTPAWVQRLLAEDSRLRDYEQSQREVVRRLRSDAEGWVLKSSEAIPHRLAPRQGSKRARVSRGEAIVMMTAACVLVASLLWLTQPEPRTPPLAEKKTKRFERPDVERFFADGRNTAETLVVGFDQYAAILPATSPTKISRLTRKYVQEAGSVYGRSLALLDRRAISP